MTFKTHIGQPHNSISSLDYIDFEFDSYAHHMRLDINKLNSLAWANTTQKKDEKQKNNKQYLQENYLHITF